MRLNKISNLIILILCGCQQTQNVDVLKSEILTLHEELKDAHLQKNIEFFTENLSSNFISVSNGEISFPSVEDIRTNFKNYLMNADFSEYIDLQEPIIGFSNDKSIAWSIVQVSVKGKREIENGAEREIDFVCAWMTLYKKQGNAWIRFAEVSNFR